MAESKVLLETANLATTDLWAVSKKKKIRNLF